MTVLADIPDDIAARLAAGGPSPDRAALEGLAAEGYRSGVLSESEVMRLLSFPSRFDVHAWLCAREIPYQYSPEDLESDLSTLAALGLR
jgi:hypothetical protein